MELESWEASAHLQLQQSKDSKNTGILLVEEYGSLLARAGEFCLLTKTIDLSFLLNYVHRFYKINFTRKILK